MSNERIKQLADHVRDVTPKLIIEAEASILESIDVARENLEEDKPLVLSLPLSVKWDMDSNKIEIALSVNLKRKWVSEASLPDPNQPPLVDRDGQPLAPSLEKPLRKIRNAVNGGDL